MRFNQYKVPGYGGYIGVIIDGVLLEEMKSVDHGLPLCDYDILTTDVILTSVGEHLKQVFERINFKFTVLYYDYITPPIEQNYIVQVQNVYKLLIQSIFSNASFQIIKQKEYLPQSDVITTHALQMRYDVDNDVKIYVQQRESSNGVRVYADLTSPPQLSLMGQFGKDHDTPSYQPGYILTGVIICNETFTEQRFFSIIIELDVNQMGNTVISGYRSTYSPALDIDIIKDIVNNQIPESEDPYGDGDNPNPDGGDGTQDDSTDTIDDPELPGLSTIDTGFLSIYQPQLSQVKALQNYVYDNDWWDITDALKNIVINPLQCVLGFHIVPVAPKVSEPRDVKLGAFNSGVYMPPVTNQFVKKNCGSLLMQPFYNTFLDYQPHTQVEIYLPFIGSKQLDPDLLFSKKNQKYLSVSYTFDVLNGICVAFVKVDNSVMYTFTGQCCVQIPLTQLSQSNTINFQASLGSLFVQAHVSPVQQAFMVPGLIESGLTAGKQTISKTGSIQGDQGYMSNRTPYLTITRPDLIINPVGQRQKLMGYPSEQFYKLGDLKGYTKISEVHLQNIQAPSVILEDIERQLKTGVVI